MNRTELLAKLQSGETVTPEMLAAVQAAEQLEQLQSEADELNNVKNLEAERTRRREARISALLGADAECEAAARDYESALAEFDALARAIGRRLNDARTRITAAQQDFNKHLAEEISGINKLQYRSEPEIEVQFESLLSLLHQQGAALSAIRHPDWQPFFGQSARYVFVGEHYYRPKTFAFGAAAYQVEKIAASEPTTPPAKQAA